MAIFSRQAAFGAAIAAGLVLGAGASPTTPPARTTLAGNTFSGAALQHDTVVAVVMPVIDHLLDAGLDAAGEVRAHIG